MTHVDNTLGNILIKHHDTWRGDYYLKDDMTFTADRSSACRFYLLKPGDTTINNGDRVSINSGNRTLSSDNTDKILLTDRNNHTNITCIISNGTDNLDPITYEGSLFFITDKIAKKALCYDWKMELIENSRTPHPSNSPIIINKTYGNDSLGENSPLNINSFRFFLEKADRPITRVEAIPQATQSKTYEVIHEYKGVFLIVFLMMILVFCIMIENGRILNNTNK